MYVASFPETTAKLLTQPRVVKFYNPVGISAGRKVDATGGEVMIVARQNFDRSNNTFELDLHGCSMEEGRTVAGHRIRECFRYGVEELRIIYGSADHPQGTLRQAVEEAVRGAGNFVAACSFRDSYGMFAAEKESTEVRVSLTPNPRPQVQDGKMVFAAFTSRYDTERHGHEPYYPLRSSGRSQG
jgi:hypothetical protein